MMVHGLSGGQNDRKSNSKIEQTGHQYLIRMHQQKNIYEVWKNLNHLRMWPKDSFGS